MKIESIAASNLKAPSFKHELGAVNILVGDNYSGKSARLEAIRLGLLGFVPGLPKTNAGIFSLSCGSQMGVTLRLSDGTDVTRHYSQKGETIKAVEMANGLKVPPVLMDAGEYLRLSDRERVKYVFSLVSIGDKWSGETILRTIGETPIDCEPEIVEAVVLAKRAIFDRLSESDHDRHEADGPVQEWLEAVLVDLRERVRNTTAALSRMEKYSQAAVELKAGSDQDAANVDRLLRERSAELKAIGERLAVAKAQQESVRNNAAMRAELQRKLAEPWNETALESTHEQIKALGPKVEGHKSNLPGLAAKVAEAKGQLEAARAMEKRIVSEITALNRQHELDAKAPKCPHCGTKGAKFKEAIEEHFRERMAELESGQKKTVNEHAKANKSYLTASEAYEAEAIADKQFQQDRMLLQSLKGEVNRLETLAQNRAMWTKQLDGLEVLAAPSQTDIAEMSKAVASLTAEVDDLSIRQKRWVAAAHEAKRQAEAKAQRQTCEAELVALKAVVKSVEVIQAAMVEDAFGKILADANRFTDGILLTPLGYHAGEVGRWAGQTWVPHRSFSGTEQLISCAGISVALARQSPIKIVLLDELGRLTAANKRRLVDRLLALTQEGFIDQAVAVDVDAGQYRGIEGMNLIEI